MGDDYCLNRICPECRIHTKQKIEWLGNGYNKKRCEECGNISPIYDANGNEVSHEEFLKARVGWN
jgi:hypothetical protein